MERPNLSPAIALVFIALAVRLMMSMNPDFLMQAWFEEGTIHFFSAKYTPLIAALKFHGYGYINLVPNAVANILVGQTGSERTLLYYPLLFKIINWAIYTGCCATLVSKRFNFISGRLQDRWILALLFSIFPHLDFSFGYNSTYGAIFILLWIGAVPDRRNQNTWLYGLEILLGILFSVSKPVIAYAAIPYFLLNLAAAIKTRCYRSIVLFSAIIGALTYSIISTESPPEIDGKPATINAQLFFIIIHRLFEAIILSLNGYFSLPILDHWAPHALLILIPVILFIVTLCVSNRLPINILAKNIITHALKLTTEFRTLVFFGALIVGACAATTLYWDKWRAHSLIFYDAFAIFNRHIFPVFVSVSILTFALTARLFDLKSFKAGIHCRNAWITFFSLQILLALVFFRNPISIPPVEQLRTAAQLDNPAAWSLTVSDLMGAYPCAPISPLGHAINCRYETREGRPFSIQNGEEVELAPVQNNGLHIRIIVAAFDHPLGACSQLRIRDQNTGGIYVGRRESEERKFVVFSFDPPVPKATERLLLEVKCSAGNVQGRYYILEM